MHDTLTRTLFAATIASLSSMADTQADAAVSAEVVSGNASAAGAAVQVESPASRTLQ